MARTKSARPQPVIKSIKDEVVRMRIPAEQKKALVEAAAREGLELSSWLRRLALKEAGLLPANLH